MEDAKINVKIKLSALWVTLMLIYIYVDIFGFYKPGTLDDILAGKVWKFEISQAWALGALVLMMIPALMVYLCLSLPAKVNRLVNMIVSMAYIIVGAGTMMGENWTFYIIGHSVGIVLLLLVIWTAWTWPKKSA